MVVRGLWHNHSWSLWMRSSCHASHRVDPWLKTSLLCMAAGAVWECSCRLTLLALQGAKELSWHEEHAREPVGSLDVQPMCIIGQTVTQILACWGCMCSWVAGAPHTLITVWCKSYHVCNLRGWLWAVVESDDVCFPLFEMSQHSDVDAMSVEVDCGDDCSLLSIFEPYLSE